MAAASSRAALRVGGESWPGTLAAVPSLAPGASFSFQVTRQLIAQRYTNLALADYDQIVSESDESNNEAAFVYTVTN